MARLRDQIFPGRHIKIQVLLLGVFAWCIVLFFYGAVMYTDAPYKPCDSGNYCGKTGRPHSRETYEDWKRWEGLLFVSWPFGMMASFGLSRLRKQPSSY